MIPSLSGFLGLPKEQKTKPLTEKGPKTNLPPDEATIDADLKGIKN